MTNHDSHTPDDRFDISDLPPVTPGQFRPAAPAQRHAAGRLSGGYPASGARHGGAGGFASRSPQGFSQGARAEFGDNGGFVGYGFPADDGLVRVRKKRRKGAKIALIIVAVVVALVVGAAAALALWINSINTSMGFDNEEERQALSQVLERPVAVEGVDEESTAFYMLILGSDARGDEASRSDVTMLARIDPDKGIVDLISIPRDTMVTIEGQGTQKINAAYAFGGAAGAVQTVSEFAGVPITHYAEVHFDELERVVDMLGGIWVDVPEGFDNGGVSLSAGEQKLTGEQALAFARERYNVSGGDFSRAQAQRVIVQAIITQVLACSPAELPGVIGELASCVTTDYSVTDLVTLAQQFQGKSMTMYSAACPSYTLTQDGVSYVATMFDEWQAMMRRVDAGLDPNDEAADIPAAQQKNADLGSAANSPAPREYAQLAANAGLTTDDVAPE